MAAKPGACKLTGSGAEIFRVGLSAAFMGEAKRDRDEGHGFWRIRALRHFYKIFLPVEMRGRACDVFSFGWQTQDSYAMKDLRIDGRGYLW